MDTRWLFFTAVLLFSLITVVVVRVTALALEGAACCTVDDHDTWAGKARQVDVVVVGGGVAGLTAVNTLLQHNVTDVVLLEAQDRLGGRIRTFRQGEVVVEDGAEWIHGDERNWLHRIARSLAELDQNLSDDDWDWRVVTQDGQTGDIFNMFKVMSLMEETEENGVLEPYYNTSYGAYFLDRFSEVFPPSTPQREALLHHLHQSINTLEGTDSWLDIAAEDADQYVDLGDDFQWKNGFDTLVTHLKEKLPESIVHLSSPVYRVIWNCARFPSQALVVTQGDEAFLARHVLITVSSAYLQKHHDTLFQPRLPDDLLHSLEGVRLGVANKIQIGWSDPWWGPRPIALDILWTHFNLPQHMSWLYSVAHVLSVHRQRAVLEMFVTGENSTYMEELQEDEVKDHVVNFLKKASGQDVPQPTFFRRTRWSRDPWTLGSFSTFITVEGNRAGLRRRTELAKPLTNSAGHKVVLWAGEHTHNTRYGTVDGAMDTGKQEALRMIRLLKSSS